MNMNKKYLFAFFFVFLSSQHITADRLDHLEAHLDHDDDFHDHLDDLDLFDDDDHDDLDHDDIIERQLLNKIEQFLPNQESPQFVAVSHTNPTNLEKSLGFGLPLIPANDQPSNDITIQNIHHEVPQSFSVPSPPQIQHEPPRETFGVPLPQFIEQPQQSGGSIQQNSGGSVSQHNVGSVSHQSGDIIPQNPNVGSVSHQSGNIIPQNPNVGSVTHQSGDIIPQNPNVGSVSHQSGDIIPQNHNVDSVSHQSGDIIPQNQFAALNQPVEQPIVIVRDSAEDYDIDIPVLVDPAPLGIDPAHQDYDDIQNNAIGGQGRQLHEGQPSFAPQFDPFEGNYPRYALVPRTSFSCGDHQFGGYYADPESDCQVFHICLDGGLMGSFLCPNGTLFNQAVFVCDWWFNVDCSLASQSYQLNARIGVDIDSDEEFV